MHEAVLVDMKGPHFCEVSGKKSFIRAISLAKLKDFFIIAKTCIIDSHSVYFFLNSSMCVCIFS